jgi:hypothetical protein
VGFVELNDGDARTGASFAVNDQRGNAAVVLRLRSRRGAAVTVVRVPDSVDKVAVRPDAQQSSLLEVPDADLKLVLVAGPVTKGPTELRAEAEAESNPIVVPIDPGTPAA